MRIGMPTTSYPAHEGDAAGAFVRTLARALARRGHTIDVIAPRVQSAQSVVDRGVSVHRVAYGPPRLERTFGRHGAPDNLAHDLLAWPGALSFPLVLDRALAQHAPGWGAIVSHFVVPTSLVAARHAGDRPHVAVAHGTDAHVAARVPGLARRVRASCTQLVCVSGALAERLGAPEARVQPMGVEATERTERPARDEARRALGLDRFTALSLSRLVPIKGVDTAIRAVASRPDVTLVVAGDGPERGRLEALARSLGADARFVGHVHGATRDRLLAAADVLVAPSRAIGTRVEGTPTSVLLALAWSLPIVGTRLSGIGEAVPDDAGLLSACSTPATIAADLGRLAADAALREQLARGALRASARFDADVVAARFARWLGEPERQRVARSSTTSDESA